MLVDNKGILEKVFSLKDEDMKVKSKEEKEKSINDAA